MTTSEKNEFNQWFEKILNQTPTDKREYILWEQPNTQIDFWKGTLRIDLFKHIPEDKILEFKKLIDKFL